MTDSIIDPLRTQAASDATWAETRIKTYQDDGAPIPEPIRRLSALASLALTHTPKPADSAASDDLKFAQARIETIRAKLGAREDETTEGAADRIVASVAEALAKGRAVAIRALRDVASVTVGVADDLERLDAKTTDLGSMKITHPAGTSVALVDSRTLMISPDRGSSSLGGTDAEIVNGPKGPALVTTHEPGTNDRKREQIALSHGLALVNVETKHGVVITEPKEGRWFAQVVLANGLGDPYATNPGEWWSDKWDSVDKQIPGIAPHWKAAQKGTQTEIPGSGPLPGATPPESAKKRVGDWIPTDTDIAGYSKSIGEALAKAGVPATEKADASPKSIAVLISRYKSEKADATVTNPGLSFYHWAVKQLKGA